MRFPKTGQEANTLESLSIGTIPTDGFTYQCPVISTRHCNDLDMNDRDGCKILHINISRQLMVQKYSMLNKRHQVFPSTKKGRNIFKP